MPINIIGSMVVQGPEVLPGWQYIKSYGPLLAVIGGLKYYCRGTTNTWERDLHGKVYIITGGTSGLGAALVDDLAARGAQLILLVRSIEDAWLTEYIQDLRDKHSNFLIYAEECDLSSLYSVRKFATKWLDNSPPRRLDGVVCTAAEALPYGKERENSIDGLEIQTAVNYVGHYHLLTLLSPSLRAQIPDRDVRVILTTCLSQAMGNLDLKDPLFIAKRYPKNKPWTVYGTSKLQLGLFAKEFQRRLLAVPRKDGSPLNVRVNVVNPGFMRSPSTKRVLSFGSLFGLFLYLVYLPILWVFLKSSAQGIQSILYALMCPDFINLDGGNFISECDIYKPARAEFEDAELQKNLFDATEKFISEVEKDSAYKRKKAEAIAKKSKETKDKKEKESNAKSNDNSKEDIGLKTNSQPKGEVPLFPELDKDGNIKSSKPAATNNSKSKNNKKGKKGKKT
ncbi:Retinol dehydrogenase 13 [Wickerhamomyces ciferrii]|uniref:Retinol dehydrogenase 13 n=1 Tax=Wickerhamomyces ciferrii (strain ATCC 14091 / BCRC 22168 / CBS 111 / JCM 3599 / NBRC 0793 / NRRL Y-1031 F-60-10) TaxID=1206466 RepID=K0KU36_WICCF|nr:Retinol dehydrogenase 13 [Wickerhamomyces ciferrii]CCH44738.1 Retinol dehydrogenase 13 [Wickerhamomyces ciferrii]